MNAPDDVKIPEVVRIPVSSAYLWHNLRMVIQERLAEAGDTRPLPDSELLVIAMDCALLFAARGKDLEGHATRNSDVLSWIRIETEQHLPRAMRLDALIAEARENLDQLTDDFERFKQGREPYRPVDTQKGDD